MAASPLELAAIPAVSPSLAEQLRLCALRAGLSRVQDAGVLVLGNPKAWLGTAYHEVLAAARDRGRDASAAEVWEHAVGVQHERALAHPLNHRFGPPDRWPGYHLIRAMALMRAPQVASEGHPQEPSPGRLAGTLLGKGGAGSTPAAGHERWLTAAGGRLVGRPDLLRNDAVIDYKTGDLFEYGEDDVVRASYVRQLQLYAFLVKEATGRWPARGVLLPMQGQPVEIELHPRDCEETAREALELLDKYNGAVSGSVEVKRLASPSPETCRWCPFQLVCPAFWAVADGTWSEHLGTAAIGGTATLAPLPIHGGAALALRLSIDEGTEGADTRSRSLAPLLPAIHSILPRVQAGARVRVVGLAKRADGTVTPTKRTVIALAGDLPPIVVRPDSSLRTAGAATTPASSG